MGGFEVGGAANGLTSPGGRGSSHPLTLRVESFLLSPLSGSFAFLSGLGGGGKREPEAWEGVCGPHPRRAARVRAVRVCGVGRAVEIRERGGAAGLLPFSPQTAPRSTSQEALSVCCL